MVLGFRPVGSIEGAEGTGAAGMPGLPGSWGGRAIGGARVFESAIYEESRFA